MKKNLISIVLFLFSILFIPQVYAMNLESISIINASDSYKGGNPSIVGNGTNNVVVTYNAADLKIVPKDLDIGRTIDAAWIGAKIVAPKDIEINVASRTEPSMVVNVWFPYIFIKGNKKSFRPLTLA